jgi:hypothetical protein
MTGIRRRVTPTRRRAVGVLAAVAALLVVAGLVVAGPAEPAGAAITTFTMAPAAGPPGTVVHVRGQGCAPGVLGSPRTNFVTVTATTLDLVFRAPVSSDGTWNGSFTVPPSGAGGIGTSAPVAAACISTGVASLMTIYAPKTFTVTAASPPAPGPGAPPTTGEPSDGTVVIPGDTTTVISVPPTGDGGSAEDIAVQDAAQPGAGTQAGAAPRDPKTRQPQPATLQPAGIDARSAALTGGAGFGWLGWTLVLVLLLAASGASGYVWRTRHPQMGTGGDTP